MTTPVSLFFRSESMLLAILAALRYCTSNVGFSPKSSSALPPSATTNVFIFHASIERINTLSAISTRDPMVRLLIFDIGGVIIDYDEAYYIRYMSKKLHLDR